MKKLFSESELLNSTSTDILPCQCYYCKKTFYLPKHRIQIGLNEKQSAKGMFCSHVCFSLFYKTKQLLNCTNCDRMFEKTPYQMQKSKSGNHFCSKSCAAIYNNTHKTKGNRRSKLEIYLENELKILYPDLKIDFNQTNAINSELDIYIPSLKLAFELNGIFHYEPIYGQDKLARVQNNDNRKFQACGEKNIELCVIDTSHEKYFKEQTSKKFLNIIVMIINNKIVLGAGNDPAY